MSLLWRLIAVYATVGALMLAVASLALLNNARNAVSVEVDAGMNLARDYVVAAVGSLTRNNPPEVIASFLAATLFQPRHVTISIIDSKQDVTHFARPPKSEETAEGAPEWFGRLLQPPEQEMVLPLQVGTDSFGEVIIGSNPQDEIDEVWEDFRTLASIATFAYVFTLVLLSIVLLWALRPLQRIVGAFTELEKGDFTKRVGKIDVPEFAVLAERFDSLAETVSQTLTEKDRLNRRLVELQDEERRAVAMELHDEFGPSLFGLKVEARAVERAADDAALPQIQMGARSILEIVEHIQAANRNLLDRLRPKEIGQLPLSVALDDLIHRLRQFSGGAEIELTVEPAVDGQIDEVGELTLYRITQEGVTNALRHSGAKRIDVILGFAVERPEKLALEIRDDGCGWSGAVGSGIRGMRERLGSLGGDLTIGRDETCSTLVRAVLPVKPTSLKRLAS